MTVLTLAAELGIDIADVGVAVRWLTANEVLDEAALELQLRGILDPAGQRTARNRAACPELRADSHTNRLHRRAPGQLRADRRPVLRGRPTYSPSPA